MISFLKWMALILFIAVLQTSVLPQYFFPYYKPDLFLIFMVMLALRAPFTASLPASYSLGLLKDCLGGIYFGLNAFSFLIVYLIIKLLSDRLYVQNTFLLVLTVSASTVSVMAINLLLLTIFSESPGLFSSIFHSIIPHLLMNAFAVSLTALFPEINRNGTAR